MRVTPAVSRAPEAIAESLHYGLGSSSLTFSSRTSMMAWRMDFPVVLRNSRSAYAALQGWGALVRFAWAHEEKNLASVASSPATTRRRGGGEGWARSHRCE